MDVTELSIMELECSNYDNALKKIRDLAQSGCAEYILLLSDIYRLGIGIDKNEKETSRLNSTVNHANHRTDNEVRNEINENI